jgi:hypothetical protein
VAATIMGNASIAPRGEKKHLIFEGVGGQGPSMTEHDRLTGPPILEVNLRTVFGGNGIQCGLLSLDPSGQPI